ncbi:hypothetical protein MY04_1346 [Flammeovirga sp. MY04]|uniref:hypothetical protein n=1 Tax=Flammeovirga sp. MY04 TaxID=1191459 RepID=UPI00080613BC|nr:hypothetical protein [Flammeovirga sp. MY04]ANQ48722.1 hypothetical protein MY04_1346 [Flammeovirga sp. MY04]
MDGTRRNCQWWLIGVLQIIVFNLNAQSAEQLYFRAAYRDVHILDIDSTKHFFTLPMAYGESEILNLPEANDISRLQIDSVLLVYTDHPKDFDFSTLNTNRIKAFTNWFDGAIDDPVIRWRIIKQVGGETKKEFSDMFHGIVVYYDKHKRHDLTPEEEVKRRKHIDQKFHHLVKKRLGEDQVLTETTSKVFEKNRDNWNKAVVVSDWTGSMYPYTLDLLSWLIKERAQDQVIGFVFFNDGDTKLSHQKLIGSTGGIYSIKSSKVMPVMDLMSKVKKRGDGGDIPENDMEAIIEAQTNFPDANTFILVADNQSKIRDLELIGSVNHPIHIILNTAEEDHLGIPIVLDDYKKIALFTKGSIYVNNQEFKTIDEIKSLRSKK